MPSLPLAPESLPPAPACSAKRWMRERSPMPGSVKVAFVLFHCALESRRRDWPGRPAAAGRRATP